MVWNKNVFFAFSMLLLILFAGINSQQVMAVEKQAYVIDQISLQVHSGPGNQHPILKTLPSGSKITILNDAIGNGYAEIKLTNGSRGYALMRNLTNTPLVKTELISTKKPAQRLRRNNTQIQSGQLNSSQTDSLLSERNQLADELEILRHTAANALDLERQRNDLQERVVKLERNNRHLKLENQALENKSSHDWFLLGAGVLFAGIIIGLLFTRISGRKKPSAWDSL